MSTMYMTTSTIATPPQMNGMGSQGLIDGSGTINPAALNNSGASLPPSSLHPQASSRGQKRSRSPDYDGGDLAERDDEQKARKRGRPSGGDVSLDAPSQLTTSRSSLPDSAGIIQSGPTLLPQKTASSSSQQTSPTKPAPTKPPVIKALPTVRDHTTDQLTAEADEYIPREFDQEGEKKVDANGHLMHGRQYRMRTFYVTHRASKLFMLATECARVLGYRDSYLLFNKNRSLHKIIASQAEKDELIQQDILPYSYRSRQIALVTAKSMFRQFGARVINNGRRVRDDYWEAKARKQGFTEEDMAGDKRPGTGKARESAALAMGGDQSRLANQDVTYKEVPLPSELSGPLPSLHHNTPIPMIQTDAREYGAIPHVRQDLSSTPYQDKSQPSLATEIMHQASNAAEASKHVTQQRNYRTKTYQDSWNKKIEPPVSTNHPKVDQSPVLNQRPDSSATSIATPSHQHAMLQHQAGGQGSPQRFHSQPHAQNPHLQSPRQAMPPSMRPELHHPQRPSSYTPGQQHTPQPGAYGYPNPSAHLWGHSPLTQSGHAQPHQSPGTQHPAQFTPHYSPSPQQQQPQHPSQSPHHAGSQALPQLPHAGSQPNFYGNMGGMAGSAGMYGGMGQARGMYSQQPQQQQSPMHQQPSPVHAGSPNPQQQQQQAFMQQTSAAQQGAIQGFAPPSMNSGGQNWGGYPASSGY